MKGWSKKWLEGLVALGEQVFTQVGEAQGGKQVPKLINALKQVWREEEKPEWKGLWRRSLVGAGLCSVKPHPPGLSIRNITPPIPPQHQPPLLPSV
jgi:hypothetical protein